MWLLRYICLSLFLLRVNPTAYGYKIYPHQKLLILILNFSLNSRKEREKIPDKSNRLLQGSSSKADMGSSCCVCNYDNIISINLWWYVWRWRVKVVLRGHWSWEGFGRGTEDRGCDRGEEDTIVEWCSFRLAIRFSSSSTENFIDLHAHLQFYKSICLCISFDYFYFLYNPSNVNCLTRF